MNLRRMFAMCLFFVTSSSSLAMDSNQQEKKVEKAESPRCIICFDDVPEGKSIKTPCCNKEICDTHLYKWCQDKRSCPFCRKNLPSKRIIGELLKNNPNICLACVDEQNPEDNPKFIIPRCKHVLCARCAWHGKLWADERKVYCPECECYYRVPEELFKELVSWFYLNKSIDVRDLPGMSKDKMSDEQVVDWLCSLYGDRSDVFIEPYYDPHGAFFGSTPPHVIGHLGIDDGDELRLDFDVFQYMLDCKTRGDEAKYITIHDPVLAKKFIDAFHLMKERKHEEWLARQEAEKAKQQEAEAETEYAEWLNSSSYDEPLGPGCNIF